MALLNISLTFENVWPTPAVRWRGTLSIELAVCLLGLAAVAHIRRSPLPRLVAALSAVWTALAIGRYSAVTAPALYGRDFNIYWELRFVPDVVAMVTRVAPVWLIVVSVAVVVACLTLVYLLLRWSWTTVAAAMMTRGDRRIVFAVAIAAVVLFFTSRSLFATPVTPTFVRQARFVVDAFARASTLPPSPAFDADLAGLTGTDVFVVFVESYGAVSYERSDIAPSLAPAMARFEAAIRETKRDVVSAYVESPTFGGSSWLAHVSLLSGVEVRDPDANAHLMAERRDTLVRLFARRGFRTVALMPGLRQRWPEGAFYGFDEIYGATRIGYRGPSFGWFVIPDQFSLYRLDALELDRRPRARLFVFFPTISTHFPFSPTPPYQPDWSRMANVHPYDAPDLERAYAREPEWPYFAPGYVDAIAYDFETLGAYLRRHADGDFVMILLGDHQPPAVLSGRGAPWDVPVHVVAARPDLLGRLVAHGFRRGLWPARPAIGRMHALLPRLLDAFGSGDGHREPEIVRSKEKR